MFDIMLKKIASRPLRDPSHKSLRSLFSAQFSGHCILSGGTQRRALSCYQSYVVKIIIDSRKWEIASSATYHAIYLNAIKL